MSIEETLLAGLGLHLSTHDDTHVAAATCLRLWWRTQWSHEGCDSVRKRGGVGEMGGGSCMLPWPWPHLPSAPQMMVDPCMPLMFGSQHQSASLLSLSHWQNSGKARGQHGQREARRGQHEASMRPGEVSTRSVPGQHAADVCVSASAPMRSSIRSARTRSSLTTHPITRPPND